MKPARLSLLACAGLLALRVQAAGEPHGWFVEAGAAEHSSASLTLGLAWRWSWQREWAAGKVSGQTEVFLSYWSARGTPDRKSFAQVGVLPLLRYGFSGGQSPWFVEGGIGVSLLAPEYRTQQKRFGSVFNFVDTVGVGRSFGERREHEWSLRFNHLSNGGIRTPNPGENLLQLRYATWW